MPKRASRPPRRSAAQRRARRPEPAPPAPPVSGPAPPSWRDAWALVPLLAALALAARAWFPFVGEPIADDFDFLEHARSSGSGAWWDGGGARFYWRPLARQLYYRLFGEAMLAHPAWIAALAAACLALAALLLYAALRRRWPGTWAAAAASFPLLLEAGRPLISSPTNFQDLGALLFSALALFEASRRRLANSLAALLAALLCKEMAVVTAAALPLVAMAMHPAGERPRRARWVLGTAAVVAAWAVAYRLVIVHAGLLLARDAGQDPRALATPWPLRFLWACRESLNDSMSLPALAPGLRTAALVALGAIAAALLASVAADRAARARVRGAGPWIAGGLAWFALVTATLADVYPDWRPYRSPFGALGLGVALTALLGAARPALLAALVAVRLATFTLAPGPPPAIDTHVRGSYSLDFSKLVQLQRLVGETRRELTSVLPRPAPGTGIAMHYFPQGAFYAFAGDQSLHAWYGDTTLHWATLEGSVERERPPAALILELQPSPPHQVIAVSAEGLWHLELGAGHIAREEWSDALRELARAESLQHNPDARVFTSMVAGKRALALGGLGRTDEAAREAALGLALWDANDDARFVLAYARMRAGRLREAEALFETLVRTHPQDSVLRRLLSETRQGARGERPRP